MGVIGVLACAGVCPVQGGDSGTPTPSHTFGRGFDLDRGTDFRVTLGGIPANLPSTVWGPGLLDTNIWIPELEAGEQVRTGPHPIEEGSFAIAGSARKEMTGKVAGPTLAAEYGGAEADRYARLLWMDSRQARGASLTYALEGVRNGRPWDELDPSSRLNAAFRIGREDGDLGWDVTLLATRENGDGGGPDPLRDAEGEDLHAGDGVRTRRLLVGAGLRRQDRPGVATRVQAYGGASALNAWGDYTYFLHDPVRGDQRERVDRRGFAGLEASREWRGPGSLDRTLGVQLRVDQVSAADLFATADRLRLRPLMQASGTLCQGAVYGQGTARLGAGWQASAGLRLDAQRNEVGGRSPVTRGRRSAALLSPRLGLAWRPGTDTALSLEHGMGLRPGNAFRDAQPLTRSTGTDLALRTRVLGPWTGGITLWSLDLEAETGLDPDWTGYRAQGRSRRHGLEWHNLAQRGPWSAELCLAWTRARSRDLPAGRDRVPGAVGQTGFLALGWKGASRSAKLTVKRLGAYALTGDGGMAADPQSGMDLKLTQEWRDWSCSVSVLNAFGKRKFNQEYVYRSRLRPEPGAVWGRHTRSADPQAIRLELSRRF